MFIARVVGKERAAPVVVHPVVVVYLIIGGICQLDLPWQHGHGQGAAMPNELGALIGARRIRRIAQG